MVSQKFELLAKLLLILWRGSLHRAFLHLYLAQFAHGERAPLRIGLLIRSRRDLLKGHRPPVPRLQLVRQVLKRILGRNPLFPQGLELLFKPLADAQKVVDRDRLRFALRRRLGVLLRLHLKSLFCRLPADHQLRHGHIQRRIRRRIQPQRILSEQPYSFPVICQDR